MEMFWTQIKGSKRRKREREKEGKTSDVLEFFGDVDNRC